MSGSTSRQSGNHSRVPVLKIAMTATSTDPLERLEATLALGRSAPNRRMLIVVNPYATTVSDRLKNLVVYALRGRYEVDAIDTNGRNHATELGREAAREGYDVVVAFGGDGTVNEAANGLAGSKTPLCCLPGGRANVYCRMLGIPTDVVDATEHLLLMADDWHPQRVDIGRVDDRKFLFSAGVGLDASVVERVDAHPRLKARFGEWYYTSTSVQTFARNYLVHPPRLEAELAAETVAGVTVIVQNTTPYTYFGERPVEMARGPRCTAAISPPWCSTARARSTWSRSSPARSRAGSWSATTATSIRFRACVICGSGRSISGRSPSRSTATSSATSTRPRSA